MKSNQPFYLQPSSQIPTIPYAWYRPSSSYLLYEREKLKKRRTRLLPFLQEKQDVIHAYLQAIQKRVSTSDLPLTLLQYGSTVYLPADKSQDPALYPDDIDFYLILDPFSSQSRSLQNILSIIGFSPDKINVHMCDVEALLHGSIDALEYNFLLSPAAGNVNIFISTFPKLKQLFQTNGYFPRRKRRGNKEKDSYAPFRREMTFDGRIIYIPASLFTPETTEFSGPGILGVLEKDKGHIQSYTVPHTFQYFEPHVVLYDNSNGQFQQLEELFWKNIIVFFLSFHKLLSTNGTPTPEAFSSFYSNKFLTLFLKSKNFKSDVVHDIKLRYKKEVKQLLKKYSR